MNTKRPFAAGLILGALAGAAGALILYKKRKRIRATWWKYQAKLDINRRLANLSRLTKQAYEDAIDDALARYRLAGAVAAPEIDRFAEELKRRYRKVKERAESATGDEDDEE